MRQSAWSGVRDPPPPRQGTEHVGTTAPGRPAESSSIENSDSGAPPRETAEGGCLHVDQARDLVLNQ